MSLVRRALRDYFSSPQSSDDGGQGQFIQTGCTEPSRGAHDFKAVFRRWTLVCLCELCEISFSYRYELCGALCHSHIWARTASLHHSAVCLPAQGQQVTFFIRIDLLSSKIEKIHINCVWKNKSVQKCKNCVKLSYHKKTHLFLKNTKLKVLKRFLTLMH